MTDWKTIDLAPDYEVSRQGKIRRKEFVRGVAPKELRPWMNSHGYPVVRVRNGGEGVRLMVHLVVCRAFNGPPPEGKTQVEHRDRDRANPDAANLRWSNQSENMSNSTRGGGKPRVCRFRGVVPKGKKFAAYGHGAGKTLYLGTFATEDEAARAYDDYAVRRYGEFASLNFEPVTPAAA